MKKISLVLAALILQLHALHLLAQEDADLRISVYFTSGIKKSPTDKNKVVVSEPNISSILARYRLLGSDVRPSFPDFNEADTVDAQTGESSRQMNRFGNAYVKRHISKINHVSFSSPPQ